MRQIVVVENVSPDGVMQAPGAPDEDVRGGFAHGGWATVYDDEVKGRMMAAGMASTGPMLFGRRTHSIRIDRDVPGAIAALKAEPGRNLVVTAPDLDVALQWTRRTARAIPLPIEVRPFQGEAG